MTLRARLRLAFVVGMAVLAEGCNGCSRPPPVLLDQPIELAVASKLISISDEKDRKIPLTLAHPPNGGTFVALLRTTHPDRDR